MTTLDRMLFVNYVRSYLIVLVSLLSLYVVIDLFSNLDSFTKGTLAETVRHIARYYSAHISKIFNQLSDAISLIGAMFTIAWMQRSNELMPQLSAGISTQRVIRPILLGCLLTVMLGPANQEFFIPRVAEELNIPRDDPNLERAIPVNGAFDANNVHIEGFAALRNERRVKGLDVTFPENGPRGLNMSAEDAYYVPPSTEKPSGGWQMFQTKPDAIDGPLPPYLERGSTGVFFLHTSIDFDTVTRPGNWYLYSSTARLRQILSERDDRRQAAVAVSFHRRLTRPLVGMILILMGLGVILRDQNKNVFLNVGLCIVLCSVFYGVDLGCKYLGENNYVTPPLAAWLPVLMFGPLALVLFDAAHT